VATRSSSSGACRLAPLAAVGFLDMFASLKLWFRDADQVPRNFVRNSEFLGLIAIRNGWRDQDAKIRNHVSAVEDPR
jgi:hypothetical protein